LLGVEGESEGGTSALAEEGEKPDSGDEEDTENRPIAGSDDNPEENPESPESGDPPPLA